MRHLNRWSIGEQHCVYSDYLVATWCLPLLTALPSFSLPWGENEMTFIRLLGAGLTLALSLVLFESTAAVQGAKRSITKIAGDVYRFQNNFHFSVFMVTSDGIIVTDPINADAAKWLKAELATRFNQPVKFLVYSTIMPTIFPAARFTLTPRWWFRRAMPKATSLVKIDLPQLPTSHLRIGSTSRSVGKPSNSTTLGAATATT